MLIKKWNNLGGMLRKPDAGGDAGGGTANLLTPNAGGGSNPPPQGDPNPNAGAGGKEPPANPNAGGAPAGSAPTDWRSQLPSELQEDANIKKFADISALARGYVNASKLIGANKIAIPSQHATEDDWKDVFKQLGLPESVDKYEVKFKESATIDKEFTGQFKENALKAGVLPKQAQKLADWFQEYNAKAEEKFVTERKDQQDKELQGLKEEWGKGFQTQLAKAEKVLSTFADKEIVKYLQDTGLNNDVRIVKLLAKIGSEVYKEDKEVLGGSSVSGQLTPAEAGKAIAAVMGDMKHPYHNKQHPGHKAAVAEMTAWFEMKHPSPV